MSFQFFSKMTTLNVHPAVKTALYAHVSKSISQIDPNRFQQEPAYVTALLGKLHGFNYTGPGGSVELTTTSVNDRGRGSAESITGADFAITVVIRVAGRPATTKAILGQAKKGDLSALSRSEEQRLNKQIEKMLQRTKHYVVLGTPDKSGATVVVQRSKSSDPVNRHAAQTLVDYLEIMLKCSHGDTRSKFVAAVQHSALPTLEISYQPRTVT